jgi:Xaa-Pro dipeptidase
MYADRIIRLEQLIEEHEIDAVVLNPGSTLSYLTGLSFHLMERPVLAIFSANATPILIVPELERSKPEAASFDLELYSYGESPNSRAQAFQRACQSINRKGNRIGVEPLRMRVVELRLLEEHASRAALVSAENILSELRIQKTQDEIDIMRKAVTAAEDAFRAVIPLIQLGMTERELEAELTIQLLRAGSQSEFPFSPIVASGPNSALPHATPTEQKLQAGDLLILDWGARINGYISDITRTLALGKIDEERKTIYAAVQAANQAARDAVQPGVSCGAIDQAARTVIEEAGYADFFIHRTGHGIGLEAHEPPYIRGDNPRVLEPGMTFTIEPGIYLPGRGGVRIEDDVLVTEDGIESLTTLPRDLEVIP